jgi:nicotinic acid phosphoribosyltransferase
MQLLHESSVVSINLRKQQKNFFWAVVSAIKCFLLSFSTKEARNDYMRSHSELIKPDFLSHKKLREKK